MFKRVLVPLDGSERAERAIPLAAKIASASGGTVILVRAVATPVEYGPVFAPHMGADIIESEQREFTNYLTQVASTPVLANVETETKVVAGGAALAIMQTITQKHVDLVVMTSHGRTGLTRLVLGSVAQHIAQNSPVPVVVLREHGPDLFTASVAATQPARVLVPLDGSPLAEEALDPAAALLSALGVDGEIHLTMVVMPFETRPENMPDGLVMDGAEMYLVGVAARLEREWTGLTVTWEITTNTDAAEAIIYTGEGADARGSADNQKKYTAIAMATHGRSGLSHLAFGSVTERVLHGTKIPLMIVRSHRQADHEKPRAAHAVEPVQSPEDHITEKNNHDRMVERVPTWPLF